MRVVEDITALASALTGGTGAVALIFAEDRAELASTVDHALACGFPSVAVIDASGTAAALDAPDGCLALPLDFHDSADVAAILNALMTALDGRWVHFCFNGEYIFYPFRETRSIEDVTVFMEEERRSAVAGYVIDLYAADLDRHPDGIDRDSARFDRTGYFGLQRHDGASPLERQFDIYGGLRWRYEEHVPWTERRIDRVALFKAARGLEIDAGYQLSEPEMNTISCPWHHNLTVAVTSFRAAKALRHNPRSAEAISSFAAPQSARFSWNSGQLMTLGFFEPGQWL